MKTRGGQSIVRGAGPRSHRIGRGATWIGGADQGRRGGDGNQRQKISALFLDISSSTADSRDSRKFAREWREWTLQQKIHVRKDQEVEPNAPKARPDPLSDQVSARRSARAPRKTVRTVYVRFRAVTRIN